MTMLRTNLSTRPFYNERAVRSVLGLFGLIALGLTLFNIYEIVRLRGQSRDARQTIAQNEQQARDLRVKAEQIRKGIDRVKLDAVQTAAREANSLIDRRTFSWTELLNYFQTTLPADVRIAGVSPQLDIEGKRLVQISVFSRRVEDLEEFMDALEKTGAFSGVLPRTEQAEESGVLRTELQAYYTAVAERAAPPSPGAPAGQAGKPPASSESGSGGSATNASAPAPTGGGGPR
jgi:hypothetical protein